jgi:hypothetical protein
LETVILFARYSPNAAKIAVADADLDPGPDEGNDHVLVMLPQQDEVAGRDQLAPQVRALYPAIRPQQTPGFRRSTSPDERAHASMQGTLASRKDRLNHSHDAADAGSRGGPG